MSRADVLSNYYSVLFNMATPNNYRPQFRRDGRKNIGRIDEREAPVPILTVGELAEIARPPLPKISKISVLCYGGWFLVAHWKLRSLMDRRRGPRVSGVFDSQIRPEEIRLSSVVALVAGGRTGFIVQHCIYVSRWNYLRFL